MPRAKTMGSIISHVWDDDSSTEIIIRRGKDDVRGYYVSLDDGSDVMIFYPESWDAIRSSIEDLFFEIDKEMNGE